MNELMLVSASLNALLGLSLLALWRQDRRAVYLRLWAWSWVLLGLGLMLGPVLQDLFLPGTRRNIQMLLASAALMGSQFLQLAGAMNYAAVRIRLGLWLPAFLLLMAMLLVFGAHDIATAVLFGAAVLSAGSLASAVLLWRHSRGPERGVSLAFGALAMVHASGPWLDPLGRSTLTYSLGAFVQTAACLGLILLAVARAHRDARLQTERFTRLAEHSLQGLAVLRHLRVLYANPAALRLFDYASLAEAQRADSLAELSDPEQREASLARHRHILADPRAEIEWEAERHSRNGQALRLHCLSSHIEWDGEPAELLAIIDDSARHQALEELRRQALHDELTDLPNRRFAVERLRQLTTVGAQPFALVSADLDRFQLVNETLGHAVGDALLAAIAQRLAAELPPQATLARLGEDQFLMLVEGTQDSAQAEQQVRQLLALMARPFTVDGSELTVHLSAGVAMFPLHGLDAPSLLRAADAAMHRAKARAGSSYVFFDVSMERAVQARLEAEQAMARALQLGEFSLAYQPKWQAGTRTLCGFEALVRWQRPGVGPMSPAEFVPAAERTGQIMALGQQLIGVATRQLAQWRERFGRLLPVAINVSPVQLEDQRFVPQLLEALAAQDLPGAALQIEITETAAIGNLDGVLPQLARLREAGVLCSLDDFGTGQSSLTLLRQLPIHAMKLDRSIIAPLPEAGAGAVVQATCALGRSLGLAVVAEGIETEDQAAAAEALGCTELQGYYLGRPLDAAAAEALLQAQLGATQAGPQPQH